MRPEWVIYKDEQRTGVNVTWHGALAMLVTQEGLTKFTVNTYSGIIFVGTETNPKSYKIVKER